MPKPSGNVSAGRYLATPTSGGPGVLVLHPWWGLTDFVRSVCDRLADRGFVGLAPDLYHGPTASTVEEAEALKSTLQSPRVEEDLVSALDELRAQPGVADHPLGLLGFSLGASYGIWLAAERGAEFGAVVVYYGTGDADYRKARAAFLGHFAETDRYEDPSWVREFERRLRAANLEVEIHVYPGTGHWFFEEDREDAYDAKAAHLSWDRTIAFLQKRLR
jgi:carboxymethylenebutenolidase